ncbi:MAG: DUF1289 domain-containing protein, partial [Halofilum sp. (in: g-proteobacteria)]|nr:DUF1289 domain-containing protein [Halofilum sp. (in: g-proteobacteria)]
MDAGEHDGLLIDNPCVGICTLGSDGLCKGCRRRQHEIRQWYDLPAAERDAINRRILPDAHPAVQVRLVGHTDQRQHRRG